MEEEKKVKNICICDTEDRLGADGSFIHCDLCEIKIFRCYSTLRAIELEGIELKDVTFACPACGAPELKHIKTFKPPTAEQWQELMLAGWKPPRRGYS